MNIKKIPTIKKVKTMETNNSSDDLFSFKRQSFKDPNSQSINTKLKELIEIMDSNESSKEAVISENLLSKFFLTLNKRFKKKDSSFIGNSNLVETGEFKNKEQYIKPYLQRTKVKKTNSHSNICNLSKILINPHVFLSPTNNNRNKAIYTNVESSLKKTPEKSKSINRSTSGLKYQRNDDETFVSEQKTCVSKTPVKKKHAYSPHNCDKMNTFDSLLMTSIKKELHRSKNRKCLSSKNMKDLKEDVVNINLQKESFENFIKNLKGKIMTNKKKNTSAFFQSILYHNQSDKCLNQIHTFKRADIQNNNTKRELNKEIQILKIDLMNFQKNNNTLNLRIKEENEYISKFKQLEDEVRKELINQQILKQTFKKKLNLQKKTLETLKEKENTLIEKLQKVLQIMNE